MSSPTLRKAENGVFYAHWSDGRRSKRKTMGTSNRADAEQRFAQWLLIGGHTKQKPEDAADVMTVADCWLVYETAKGENATSGYSWKALEPHFGAMLAPEVSQKTVDRYLLKRTTGRLGRRVKAPTVRRELVALFAALNHCVRQQMLPASAVNPVTLPDAGEPRDRWLRLEEIQKLLAAAAKLRRGSKLSRGERFLWLALETAARKQAILDLTWDRVDFDARVIHYDVPGRQKTKKRRASVPISSTLLPVLKRAHKERENDLVMSHKGSVWATVQSIAIEAGVGEPQPKPKSGQKPRATGISPHVFRHTAATHMARNGVSLFTISKILGNSYQVVERVYAKWSPDNAKNTVDMISRGMLEPSK